MSILQVESLSHCFPDGGFGISDIDFTLEKGAFLVITGPNGSGKTTLLRHLNGLLKPTSGDIRIDGVSVSRDVLRARQMVGMVFQDADTQIVGESVWEDAAFGPENIGLSRIEIKNRVESALHDVGMIHMANQSPHVLSGGEKRRLAIAGILAMNSEIVVFDEPFSNLDYSGTCQILLQILHLHRSGKTVILTTHDLEKIIAHADRLMIMEKGKIVRDGDPVQLLSDIENFGVRTPCAYRMGMEVPSWLEQEI